MPLVTVLNKSVTTTTKISKAFFVIWSFTCQTPAWLVTTSDTSANTRKVGNE